MAGLSSFIYGGDENVDPFGSSNSNIDPFGSSQSIDPFSIPAPTQPTLNSFDPFVTSSNMNNSIPAPISFETHTNIPTISMLSIDTIGNEEKEQDDITSVNTIVENDDEFKTEFNKEPKKIPKIAVDLDEQKKDVKEEKIEEKESEAPIEDIMITEVEDQANQNIIKYFENSFSSTFVPQLKETETEVNELIQIQGLLDNQLKVLYDKLKEMEHILSPPSYVDDLNRITKIQRRIERLNTLLNQIEVRISSLMNSRIYQKCLLLPY